MIYYNVEENLLGYNNGKDMLVLVDENGSVYRVLSDKWFLIEEL